MITVSVPTQQIADAMGEVADDVRLVVWDPSAGEAPDEVRDQIDIATIPHYTGGATVYGRLGACANLKVIQIPSAGFEHAVRFVPEGVTLANAHGVHDSRVAEMTMALILASRRLLPEFLASQRAGKWEQVFDNRGAYDSRALVVGYGSIGKAIATRLRANEMHVEGVARTSRVEQDGTVVHAVADLHDLLPLFDVVVLVTPHDESTDKLIDAAALAAMQDGALLVNVGRGKVVDTDALAAELEAGRLHAALDVTDPEPLPQGHPLWSAPHCLIVPHVAGVESLTNWRFTNVLHAQIDALRDGRDPVFAVARGPHLL